MPKDSGMKHVDLTTLAPRPRLPLATPWSLRAWPTLLWQATEPAPVRFHHLGTVVTPRLDDQEPPAGQTMWAASGADGEAGMAWDWVQVCRGVVAMADPLAVVTNLRLVSGAGTVLSAHDAAVFINQLVHTLPWQREVQRALGAQLN